MNFTEWAKQNPNKSLNDYYLEQQALQTELQQTPPPIIYSEPKTNSTLWTVLTVAISLVLGGFVLYALQKYNEANRNAIAPLMLASGEPSQKSYYSESEVQERLKRERDRTALQKDWLNLISVTFSGGQQLGIGGGFRGVHIKVNNQTDYTIDEVTVLVKLVRGAFTDKVCFVKILQLDDIPANGTDETIFDGQCGQRMEVTVVGFKCNQLKVSVKPD